MQRGRKPIPDEVKELRGNPGKRPLYVGDSKPAAPPLAPAASEAVGSEAPETASAEAPPRLDIPEFLTGDRERRIFLLVVEEYLQRRVARKTDLYAYGRWAVQMNRWINCKEWLEENSSGGFGVYKVTSPHGTYFRAHPVLAQFRSAEVELVRLEDRLGLNPAARQSIMRGLAMLPSGDLFGHQPKPEEQADDDEETAPAEPSESPLNWMAGAGSGRPN